MFWKIDFINSHLPQWMCPEIGRVKCHMKNEAAADDRRRKRRGRRARREAEECAS